MTPPSRAKNSAEAEPTDQPDETARKAEKRDGRDGRDGRERRGNGSGEAGGKGDAKVPARADEHLPEKVRGRQKSPARGKSADKAAPVVKLTSLISQPVPSAAPRRRHRLLLVSFLVIVLIPALLAAGYIYFRAVDRYASTTAFSVHREESPGASELVAGLPALGVPPTNAPDADILYQFIQSQRMVELVDARVDLRALYAPPHDRDPVFALDPEATLEDMVEYWQEVVTLIFEPDTGLITVEVQAFAPEAARVVAEAILDESSTLVNRLSKIARDDTISLAQDELDKAAARLKETRLAMATFRDVEQIVDPTADTAGQMGVITALQQNLAEALVARDLLIGTTTGNDPRLQQAERRIEAIRTRIEEERDKLGRGAGGEADALARIVGEYESLLVDREFAEQAYVTALASYDAAAAEARRKSRYLAVHIDPTLAQTAIYPRRFTLTVLAVTFLALGWTLFVLVVYSIRDRR